MNKKLISLVISIAVIFIAVVIVSAVVLDNSKTRKDICKTVERNLAQYQLFEIKSIKIVDFQPKGVSILEVVVSYKDYEGIIDLEAQYVNCKLLVSGASTELVRFKANCDEMDKQF